MAIRARLSAPIRQTNEWPWHKANWASLPASLLMAGDRRMEAENYLAGGYGLRLAIESRRTGWLPLADVAKIWQPSRLKGIQVGPEYGTPFLAATQVFDIKPAPRKFLSLDRTDSSSERFVKAEMILVTCSGSVGRTTLANKYHEGILISHDLLRVEAKDNKSWGWIYAYLRAPQTIAIMNAAQYGHVIKHLEISHLNSLPIPMLRNDLLADFNEKVKRLIDYRNRSFELLSQAESVFEQAIGEVSIKKNPEVGFTVKSSNLFGSGRRLEAAFHTPNATEIVVHFKEQGHKTEALSSLWEKEWQVTRNKCIFGQDGMPYMSADELFALNPTATKKIITSQLKNPERYYGKAGWIAMACSGQVYGLNGSVMLLTEQHESVFLSQDLIRIMPNKEKIRPGYLCMVLGHPKLGRPLVIRYAYGTSIPHIDPADVASFPVVRLSADQENLIADKVEESVRLRAQANMLENELSYQAEDILSRFIEGSTEDVIVVT